MTERILSAARERTEADVALRAELAAEASGRPPIATLSTPDGCASLRTCEGLTFAIGSVTRLEGGRVVREPGVRLVIPERTEENLRAVYGAMRAVVGPGVGGYEAWRETRLRERPVTARTAFGAATRAAVGEGERLSTRAFFESLVEMRRRRSTGGGSGDGMNAQPELGLSPGSRPREPRRSGLLAAVEAAARDIEAPEEPRFVRPRVPDPRRWRELPAVPDVSPDDDDEFEL